MRPEADAAGIYQCARRMIDVSVEPFLRIGTDGKMADINPAMENATGRAREELIGRDFADCFSEPDSARKAFRLASSLGSLTGFPLALRHSGGAITNVLLNAAAYHDGCGNPAGVLAMARPVSAHDGQERWSRRDHSRFHAVFNACPVPMVLNDGDQNILFINPEFTDTFGYSAEDIPTLTEWRHRAYPDSDYRRWVAETWSRRLEEARRDGTAFRQVELDIRCKDCTVKTVMSRAAPLGESFEGAYLVTLFDVTERIAAMRELADSRNVLQSVIETIPMRVFWKDQDSRYLGCNSVFARDAGASGPQEVIGKCDSELGWRNRAELYRADDRQVMQSNTARLGYEEPQTTPDGGEIWVRTSKLPLRNVADEIIGIAGVYDDITERKRIEYELQLAQTAIDKSKTAFFWLDPEGTVAYANDHACRNLGYTREELIGKRVWDFDPKFRAEDWPRVWEKQKRLGVIALESVHRRKDGQEFPIEVTGHYIVHNGKEHAFAIVQDISERKRADAALRQSEERLQQAVRVSDIGIFDHDHRTDMIYWSPAQRRIYGWGWDEPVTLEKYIESVFPEDMERTGEAVKRAHDPTGDGSFDVEHRIVRRDGEVRWVTNRARTFFEGEGAARRPVRTVGAVADITERKRSEQELRIAATAFESREGLMITDEKGVILQVNQAFRDLTGYGAEEAIGRNPSLLKSGRHDAGFYQEIWQAIARDGHWQGEIWNRRKNGEEFPEWLSITSVRNAQGKITNYVGNFLDISEKKAAEEEIRNLAFFDSLTKLPNRRRLVDRLQHALAISARSGVCGAVLFIDLDNFKSLNDTRGHAVGDELLLEVSRRLQAVVRAGDTVARLGGDEFVVVLDQLDADREQSAVIAKIVGDKILAILRQPCVLQGQEHVNSASIGISVFLGNEDNLEDLLKRADTAMYEAKKGGRNTLRFFDPNMQTALEERTLIESSMRQGLANSQFKLHYQMQVDEKGQVFGVEALLRWEHPERGLIPPGRFIPLAEETGFILPLGQWVIETACAQLRAWEKEPRLRHLAIAVNVSAHQFRQADFVEQVKAAATRYCIDPSKLKLELTESLVIHNVEEAISKMQQLKSFGIVFSMDDFGTGHSSLSYLKRLPLDQLKIDQSFVRDIATDPSDAVIVQTVINMGKTLGLDVIAEGVENENQLWLLRQYGCNAYQGYLFGRPEAAADLERHFAETDGTR
jgi:diguanylate cyclase (GGDEF)-like protein/PAS domain S-box-containing protein